MENNIKTAEKNDRLEREKDFHNEAFSSEKRQTTKKYYSTTALSKEFYRTLTQNNVKGKKYWNMGADPGVRLLLLLL